MLNSDGIKLLWPFSQKWYGWDLANSVDAWIIFFLLCGLLVPELFRLVLEEIGSKPKKRGRQRGAIVVDSRFSSRCLSPDEPSHTSAPSRCSIPANIAAKFRSK